MPFSVASIYPFCLQDEDAVMRYCSDDIKDDNTSLNTDMSFVFVGVYGH
jgi:hypothetical protein